MLRFPLLALLLAGACRATTSRPTFEPIPTSVRGEVELRIPAATRLLAEALAKDSIAFSFIHERDGYLDSGWLDAATLEKTGARPLGRDVVRVRAWVNPAKQFWSELVVEATYRAMSDPSRPERELDVALPGDHPLQKKIVGVIRRMVEQYGDRTSLPVAPKPDTTKVKPDTSTRGSR